ncbi:replication factor C large subunit [Methanonatronarchaeum sp. AMET-Sl]|uniref:replication factor C large subunit n=1 Tax=Methanonatronarchaeum sp. AMET-Sl TaxID=3037654 RepID=UPI00244E57EA|nr:replication factor C large subunit [Methanonatronarchaeum sp. AMET-Sl]WGI17610.1 replication factor C large subunit [Methanonatronarchaeum sp. AMET-Sl]
MSKEKWVEKYRPGSFEEIVGNRKAVKKFVDWAGKWRNGRPKKRGIRLVGPPGIGKTTAAYVLAGEFGWEVMEMNASDERAKDIVERLAGTASSSGTLSMGTGGRRLLIIDEADNLHGNADRGGKAAITRIIKSSSQPIVLIANDEYGMSGGMRRNTKKIEFKHPKQDEVVKALQRVQRKEGFKAYKNALREIARNADGDVRGAINDLQSIAESKLRGEKEVLRKEDVDLGDRNREENIWKLLNSVFRNDDLDKLRRVKRDLDSDINPDDLLHWVDSNLPKKYEGWDLVGPTKYLARASIYLGRVGTSGNYSLWSYASEMSTYGVCVSKSFQSAPKYRGPEMFGMLSKSRSLMNKQNSLTRKISNGYFVSEDLAVEMVPYLKIVFENDRELACEIASYLRLDEDEVTYLGGDPDIANKEVKEVQEIEDDEDEAQVSLGDF